MDLVWWGGQRGETRLASAKGLGLQWEASQAAGPGNRAAKRRAQNCGENSRSLGGGLEAPQTILGASGFQNLRAPPLPLSGDPGGAPGPAAAFTVSEPTARSPATTDPRLTPQR